MDFLELVRFEVYNDLNHALVSLIIKFFLWKYFTTGIIPIISSVYLRSPFSGESIFGLYDEITPVWYKEVGYGIIVGSFTRILILCLLEWLGIRVTFFGFLLTQSKFLTEKSCLLVLILMKVYLEDECYQKKGP